jgi:hypothetical protein
LTQTPLMMIPDQEAQEVLSRLKELTPQQWAQWRHHPVSKVFLRYLADYRRALLADMLAAWESGTITLSNEHDKRGRASVCAEMGDLSLESVMSFYGMESEMETENHTP